MYLKIKLKSMWNKITQPFRTFVYYHERSKIIRRAFPPTFKVSYIPSIQDRIDSDEKHIQLDKGTYLLDRSIDINKDGVSLIGYGSIMQIQDANPAIQVKGCGTRIEGHTLKGKTFEDETK